MILVIEINIPPGNTTLTDYSAAENRAVYGIVKQTLCELLLMMMERSANEDEDDEDEGTTKKGSHALVQYFNHLLLHY